MFFSHIVVVVQSLSHIWLFPTPWTACRTPGCPVFHYLPEIAQTHVHWVSDAIQSSHPLFPPSPPALNLSQHQGLLQCFAWGGQGIGASASAPVLPMNIQGWFPLGSTGYWGEFPRLYSMSLLFILYMAACVSYLSHKEWRRKEQAGAQPSLTFSQFFLWVWLHT